MISGGDIVFDSQRLSELSPKRRARLTSSGMGLIFQTPGAAFNPIRSYKKQFIETLKATENTIRAHFCRRYGTFLRGSGWMSVIASSPPVRMK